MANDVRILYRGTLAGQGFAAGGVDSSGSSKNNKLVCVGDINITTYSTSETITAKDLGLETLDCVLISPVAGDNLTTGLPSTTQTLTWAYNYSSEALFLWDGTNGDTALTSLGRVRFAAFGDGPEPVLT